MAALTLVLMVTEPSELRAVLEPELDGLWTALPNMTLWLVRVDELLTARLSMFGSLFQLHYTPEMRLGHDDSDPRRSLSAQSLTQNVSFADVVQPVFLAFTPAVFGFAAPLMPHALALEFGAVVDLRRPRPESLSAVYDSRVLAAPVNEEPRAAWVNQVPKTHFGSLLAWWVSRMSTMYDIASDPTRFANEDGSHDAAAQFAFRLTIERVLADLCVIGAAPQASALVQLGASFDLLDKLETLLGYGPRSAKVHGKAWGSGRGFVRLLDRDESLPLMRRGLETLPVQLRGVFIARAEALFDEIEEDVRDGVLQSRLDADTVLVGRQREERVPMNQYVGRLVRAVRNSSHGLLDQLAGRDAELAVTHTGALPEALPLLISLIAFALLAEPERLWSMEVWESEEDDPWL